MGVLSGKHRRIRIYLVGIAAIVIALCIPFESTCVPEWKIKVIDLNQSPEPARPIRETWNDYTLDISAVNDHEDTRTTNENGIVLFPERTTRASLLFRLFARTLDLFKPLIRHSSAGIHASVFCLDNSDSFISYSGTGTPPEFLVLSEE